MSQPQNESQRNRRTVKRILAIFLPFVIVAGVGIGYAYWTTTGTGTGSATADATPAVTVSVGAATGLAPGGTVTVPVSLSNPTVTDLQVGGLALGSVTPDAGHSGCTAALSGLTTTVTNPGKKAVPAGAANLAYGGVQLSMANSTTNQDACKGVTYTVVVTVS